MNQLIRGWTEQQTLVAVSGAIALIGAGAGLSEGGLRGLLVVVAIVPVFVVALASDSWGGMVIGIAGAALFTFLRQASASWLPADFGAAAIESVALVATGWTAGRAGTVLRQSMSADAGTATDPGVFGSVGMLPVDIARVRLEEEVARAVSYDRPLSLLLLDAQVIDPELDPAVRDGALRAVARVTETELREMDVPFLFSLRRIGAILPETDATAAAIAGGRILESISTARFLDRRTNERYLLAAAIAVRIAVVSLGPERATADALLDSATGELEELASRDR